MTTSNDLDTVSHSWDEHSEHNGLQTPIQVAEAAPAQKAAPAAAEPVPVDVGSGAPVKPEAPEAKAPAAAVPHEYVADANHVVKLPANVSIDNIKVDGHNLVLEQADGSVIVIKDAALNVPTFIIGDVEVPRVALIAALEASHVDVAFGADGSISAGPGGSTSSAGGDFSVPPGGIGDGFGLSALLPPTDLAFGQPDHRELFPSLIKPNSIPSIIDLTPSVDGGDTIVNEKGLPASSGSEGSGEAQNPAPNSDQSETNTGTFTITSPDGVASLTIAGQVISGAALANSASTPIEITTPLGNTLTISGYDASTGQVSYSYTLVHSAAHPGTGTDSIFDNMTVTVTDTDGDVSAPGTLSVQIVDDVPTANADANSIGAGSHAQISGNVITGVGETDPSASADVKGADGASVTSAFGTGPAQDVTSAVTGTTIAGQYGTLTLYSDGHYTYDRATNTPGGVNDVFHYTLTDGDGDQSNTTLTINIGNEPPTLGDIPAAGATGAIVYEAGLPSGSQHDGSNAVSGTVGFTSQDGVNSVSLGGHALSSDSGNPTTFTDAVTGGTVSAWYAYTSATGTGTIHYSYTLTADYHSATGGDGANTEAAPSFAVVVTDLDNQPASGNLVINVIDDVPTAKADTDAAQSGETVTGNVETGTSTHGTGTADTAGADGIASIAWAGSVTNGGVTTVTGAYGVLTVFANGDYSYHANPNATTGNDVFNYTITDGDGDNSLATLTITVANGQPQVSPAAATVDESGLDTTPPAGDLGPGTVDGSHAGDGSETTKGTLTFSDPDGATVTGIASGNVGSDVSGNVGANINGTYGILHVNADGTYTYTLTNPEANVPAGNDGTNVQPGQDVFTYTVKDGFGNTSTSTITISIKDDVPTAHNDTDAAQSGEKVTGNVETGTSTHGTGAADTAGADGIASIAWAGSVTNGGVTTVTGTHGVLTVFANGDYSYQATPNTPTGNDVFNYTITDGDGDTSPATLTIEVTGSQPRVVAEIATVNEAGLDTTSAAGDLGPGTVDGSHAGDGSETKSGTLTFSDPDGATVTGVASGNVGSDVSGNVGTNINGTYGILHVNADGSYTYTLTSPEANVPAGNDGANLQPGQDVFTFTVTDGLGNTSTSTISINILDDVPSITPSGTAAPTLSVDESFIPVIGSVGGGGGNVSSGNFAANFVVTPGADGQSGSTAYSLTINNSTTTLVDSLTGTPVTLVQNGAGEVDGKDGLGHTVFTLTVDATGKVTMTELRGVHQGSGETPDTSEGTLLGTGLVSVTATVTDNDGDKASASIDLGGQITIHDDGPLVSATGSAPTLSVDESFIPVIGSVGGGGGNVSSGNFAANFVVTPGADGQSGSTAYSLTINNSTTTLVDSLTGTPVTLVQNGAGEVDGKDGLGHTVFTLTVDATGKVTMTELRGVHQGSGETPDTSEGTLLGTGLVSVTATVTDNDGDKASASIDLGGQITIHDDGPLVSATGSAPTLSVDESFIPVIGSVGGGGGNVSSGNFAANFVVTPGADGQSGSTAYSLTINNSTTTLVDSLTGTPVTLVQNGAGEVDGKDGLGHTVFTLTVDATGKVTMTELRGVHQGSGETPDTSEGTLLGTGLVSVTATVTDNDGDKASASIDLGGQITIHDDGPLVSATGSAPTLSVDESFIPVIGSVGGGGGNVSSGNFAANFVVTPGADGQSGSTAYSLTINNSTTTLVDSLTGTPVTLVQNGAGEVDGKDGLGHTVFTLTVDATGKVTMTELRGVHQGSGETPDTSEGTLLGTGLVSVTATVTDNDGDKASASIDLGGQITIHDDGPLVSATGSAPTLSVDESFIPVIGSVGGGGGNVSSGNFAANFVVTPGADGQSGSTAYSLTINNSTTTLVDSLTGTPVTLVQNGAGEVDGKDGLGHTVFTLTVDATGKVTMTELRGVHQGSGETPDTSEGTLLGTGLVSVTATVTDNDGDKASASIDLGGQITIHDDGPLVSATGSAPTLSVDESFIPVIGSVGGGGGNVSSGNFAANFVVTPGADGQSGSTAYSLTINNSTTTLVDSLTGTPVTLVQNGAGEVDGKDGLGHTVFTLTVDATGKVTMTELRGVHQGSGETPDTSEGTLLGTGLVSVTATVTDNDGDKASASIDLGGQITIHDDGPSITLSGAAAPILNVDESYLANGSTPNAALTAATAAFAGMFTVVQGADGATTSYGVSVSSQGVTSNLIDSATGQAVVLTQSGGTVSGYVTGHSGDAAYLVFTLAVDTASGQATLTEFRSVHQNTADNPTDTSEGISLTSGLVTLTATVTDGDGDKASQSLDLGSKATFHDDGPSLGSFTSGTIPNEVGSVAGFFSLVPGADGIDHFNIVGPAIAGLTYNTTTALDGTTTLHAMSGATEVFDLTVRSDGTYEFDLIKPDAGTTITYSLQNLPAGGPNWRETTDGHIEFSSSGGINSNNNGFGVANSFVGGNESFTMEFHTPGTGIGVDNPPSTNAELNDSVSLVVNSLNGAGGTYHWVATNTLTNTTESGDISITSTGTFLIDPSISFNQLQVSAVNVSGQGAQFSNISLTHNVLPQDQNLAFTISATDKDGDTTGTQALGVHVVAGDGSGNYTLTGTAGNDVIAGSTHTDAISGGGGNDIVDYSGSIGAISIHLADDGHASGAPADPNNPAAGTIGGGDAAGDTLTGIEGLIGGSGNDHLFGNALANYLAGGAGNDTLNGGGGNDILVGGAGQDTLTGGTGADTFKLDHLDIKDLISDYSGVGGDGDKIDLTTLFDTAPAGNISNYVHYNSGTGALSVDTSGSGNPANFVDVAQLTNTPAAGTITILYDDNTHAQHTATI